MNLFPIAVLTSLPYIIPFSGWVYAVTVFVNPSIPWWIKGLLGFWSYICAYAAPETQANIVREGNEKGFTNTVHGAQIILNLLKYPMFIAFFWSFTIQ